MGNEFDDLLTDEERAALEEDEGAGASDGDQGDIESENVAQDADDLADADADADTGDDDPDADAGDAAPNEEDGQQGDDNAADDGADADTTKDAPPPEAIDTRALEQQLEEIKSKRGEAMQAYRDGDLTDEELDQRLEEIDGERDDVTGQMAIAKDRAAQIDQQWGNAVQGYFEANPGLKEDAKVLEAYDRMVGFVTSQPTYANLSFEKQLAAAHRLLDAQSDVLGIKVPAQAGGKKPTPRPKPETAEDKKRKKDMATPPKTLSRVPQSDMTGAGEGEYAALQRLIDSGEDPERVEAELAKMTDEERDRFSSMQT
ncbi:hypothetical protein DL1_08505 [Thioclava dalianensis]|uniref:Uncharacterized protein n=1 Tax=Thioclava dalianensis TaxID=1185766 RepID=A0A074TAL9_9RHOB|nr:hypothetical protein [Thioclava dalianensis]KEP68816.1 hypothetical protein DL1_08505 [Thioclava dalianensis]SFN50069.1 hypothetical protein SAMN05216224_10686 [Thioclava dalianensis]